MVPARKRDRYQNSRRGTHGIRSGMPPRMVVSILSRSVMANHRLQSCVYYTRRRVHARLTQQERFAWGIAAVLFGGSLINYLDRAVLGVIMPQIRRDLGLTNQQYGWAVGAFLVAYMVSYVAGGRLADRLGSRRTISITLLFWSAAALSHALVTGLTTLSAARSLLGFGEAAFYPAAMRAAAGWFPSKDRAKAVGLFLSALSVGTLITPPIVSSVTSRFGWRAAFLVTGGLGVLLLPSWLWLHRRIRRAYGTPDPEPAAEAEVLDTSTNEVPLSRVLRNRQYWCALSARACSDGAWYFYLFWMPGYLQEVRGLSLRTVGQLLWMPYLAAGIGALVGAWASSALIRRGFGLSSSRKAVLLPSAVLSIIGTACCVVPGEALIFVLLSVALFGHQSWSSNIHTVIIEIVPSAHLAVLYGVTGAAGTFMGAVAQLGIGSIVDAVGYRPIFAGVGLLYAMAAALVIGAGRLDRIRRE